MKNISTRVFTMGATIQVLIAVGHLIGHFTVPRDSNSTERKLVSLMSSYEKKVAGGNMSILQAYDGLNVTYALFFLFAGCVNYYFARKDSNVKPLSIINATAMALCTIVSMIYFFWIPVVYCAIALCVFLSAARFKS